MNFDETNYKLK